MLQEVCVYTLWSFFLFTSCVYGTTLPLFPFRKQNRMEKEKVPWYLMRISGWLTLRWCTWSTRIHVPLLRLSTWETNPEKAGVVILLCFVSLPGDEGHPWDHNEWERERESSSSGLSSNPCCLPSFFPFFLPPSNTHFPFFFSFPMNNNNDRWSSEGRNYKKEEATLSICSPFLPIITTTRIRRRGRKERRVEKKDRRRLTTTRVTGKAVVHFCWFLLLILNVVLSGEAVLATAVPLFTFNCVWASNHFFSLVFLVPHFLLLLLML